MPAHPDEEFPPTGELFRPRHNTLVRMFLFAAAVLVFGTLGGLMVYARTPYARMMQEPVEQPIEFDHRHHTRDEGIDCRYCHDTVDKAPTAGIPPTQLCLNCHSQVWNTSPLLDSVRRSFFEGRPMRWRRVYKVSEFAYFNHSIHVNKGVGCVSCHGRVDLSPAVQQETPLTMGWCLDCHRDPGPNLRPPSEVTNMAWEPTPDQQPPQLATVSPPQHCSGCHR